MKFTLGLLTNHLFIIKKLQREALCKQSSFLKGHLLDIGCGTRPYKKFLKFTSYVGIDKNSQVSPDICADSQSIPFKEGYFDSVICTELIEHLQSPDACLKEIHRVLKNGGYLYLTAPQEWSLHYEPNDYYRFTKYGIRYLFEKHHFKIISEERIGGIFSLVGQRIIDVYWQLLVNCLSHFLGIRAAEKAALILCLPGLLFFYLLGKIGDRIDQTDALGWAVLAIKE